MTYRHFDSTKPDSASQNITQFAGSTRENLAAIRDIAVLGAAPGWNYAWSGGTAEAPATMLWSMGVERLRANCLWGETGGAAGNITQAVFAYSADAGVTWSPVGTQTINYDTAGNVTSTVWS